MKMKITIISLLCWLLNGCVQCIPPVVDYYEFDRPTRQPALDVDLRGIPHEWDDAQVYITC